MGPESVSGITRGCNLTSSEPSLKRKHSSDPSIERVTRKILCDQNNDNANENSISNTTVIATAISTALHKGTTNTSS